MENKKILDRNGNEYFVLSTYEYNNNSYIIYTDFKKDKKGKLIIKYGKFNNEKIESLINNDDIKVAETIIDELMSQLNKN